MMRKKRIILLGSALSTSTLLLFAFLNSPVRAQNFIGGDLLSPTSVILTPAGGQLVVESGDGPNSGRITLFKENSQRVVLIDGLPSGPGAEGGISGPTAVALDGNRLFITIGEGDVRGVLDAPGPAIPNPNGLSSPLFSSVLSLRLPRSVDLFNSGFELTLDDQLQIADGREVTLTNGSGVNARIKSVADIQDLIPDPVLRLRPSNPFGIQLNFTLRQAGLVPLYTMQVFVADASRNTLFQVASGRPVAVTRFDPVSNPLPFGPPFSEAVPTSVRLLDEDHLLVTLLVGFPFPAGTGSVRSVHRRTGDQTVLIDGLTSPIDVLPVIDEEGTHFLVLEFSSNLLGQQPGRLLWFDQAENDPQVLADNLASPTGMARNTETGEIYVTQIYPGTLISINGPNN